MHHFIKGLELSERYYKECVKGILDAQYPALTYSAGLLGAGSEILGFDTPLSCDHDWGTRLFIFLAEQDYIAKKDEISQTLSQHLPNEFCGYPTSFQVDGTTHLQENKKIGFINHFISFFTINSFFQSYLGVNPHEEITNLDWLTFQEHKLLSVITGRIFHDGLGEFAAIRTKLSYYPREVWLFLLASQWAKIAQERAFMGRCGDVGDELGSHIIAARLVRELMRLCFLMEKQYAPYSKWFGSAFSKLDCASVLAPIFTDVMHSTDWKAREMHLANAYTTIAEHHNRLSITAPLGTKVTNYYNRPYLVINADAFVESLLHAVEDEELRRIRLPIGSVNQFVDSTDVLCDLQLLRKLQELYR